MPLVTPNTNSDNPTELWTTKLVGKTLSDDGHSETNFCKKDLPQNHRVIGPNSMVTMDFRPDRLNVHVKEDGTVHKVEHS
ncbi:hypothetical protein Micbo1qcDRAFT_203954 [Microdochium bolleyi]|uniref:Peptidase inhibitor I78 family-domain-containing protein n=1 Tax=Microdochium bolleyi TaxID=196109 RepID=A0A136J422_9PEZI|nr:hypothetical protein Micbo1qcDRAFT_203954 [Microdochium bolleyi]